MDWSKDSAWDLSLMLFVVSAYYFIFSLFSGERVPAGLTLPFEKLKLS
tara:strand:+ start:1248 stop:1391 length:144 start_codon:yes stop_codon:yes gene_type:complete